MRARLRHAVVLGLVALGSLGFSSIHRPWRSEHERVTEAAWELLAAHGETPARADGPVCRRGLAELVERVDGTELAVLLDRFTHRSGPLRSLTAPPEMVSTDLYHPRHHFDRAQRDRGSVAAFVEGTQLLGELWRVAVDPGRPAQDSVIALARALHALQDFHAHSNFAELAVAGGPPRLGLESEAWPAALDALEEAGGLTSPLADEWYTDEAPATVQVALDRVGECLAPWLTDSACGPAAGALLDGVLVLTWYPGGEPDDDEDGPPGHRRGEPTWCGSSDAYPCYTRTFSRREESDAPARACTTRYGAGVHRFPFEGDYTHECFAKDEPRFGVVPVGEVARRKHEAYRIARAYAAVRSAVLLRSVRAQVGEARWADLLRAAEQVAQ